MVSACALFSLQTQQLIYCINRFYVNLHTHKSTWEKPTAPALPEGEGPPPYVGSGTQVPEKSSHLESNQPYGAQTSSTMDEDADRRYALQLQAEEDARTHASGGRPVSRGNYSNNDNPASYANQELPPREQKSKGLGGLLSKFTSKVGNSHHGPHGGYPQYGGNQQQAYGGAYPQQPAHGYNAPHERGFGGFLGGGHGGGHGAYPPRKSGGGGMGKMAGAGALGLGAGVLGGAVIADAMYDSDGGDYGGDDFGGGDFGGGF